MTAPEKKPERRSLLSEAEIARARQIAAEAPPLPESAKNQLRLLLASALPPVTPARKPTRKGKDNDDAA